MLNVFNPLILQRTLTYTLSLKFLFCYLSDETGEDEVFIKLHGKKIWPQDSKFVSMSDNSFEIGLEFPIEKGKTLEFEIWDYDRWSPNDLLGTVTISADQSGGPYRTEMRNKDSKISKYAMEWELN